MSIALESTDLALMQRYAQGDVAAFEALLKRHEKPLWRFIVQRSLKQVLPEEQREAFLLQAESGLSVQEIAASCQVSFETAKSRLRYARNKLKTCLAAWSPPSSRSALQTSLEASS